MILRTVVVYVSYFKIRQKRKSSFLITFLNFLYLLTNDTRLILNLGFFGLPHCNRAADCTSSDIRHRGYQNNISVYLGSTSL